MTTLTALQWALIFSGSGATGVIGFTLGRVEGKRSKANSRSTWLVVQPRGMFGYEVFDEFRSRAQAERYRRHNATDNENLLVMSYHEWERLMKSHWRNDKYWDLVDELIERLDAMPKQIEASKDDQVSTTVLPVVPLPASQAPQLRVTPEGKLEQVNPATLSKEDRTLLSAIAMGIRSLDSKADFIGMQLRNMDLKTNHVEEILHGLQSGVEVLRERSEDIGEVLSGHVLETSTITEELREILDDRSGAEDGEASDDSSEAGGAGEGVARSSS